MRTEDEIFNVIKNSPEMKPRIEFVNQTKINLVKQVKRLNKRQKLIKSSYYWSGIVTAIVVVAWISMFGGTQYIANSVSQVMASVTNNNKETTPVIESNLLTNNDPLVFIHHTHNTESFMPLLNINDPDNAVAVDNKKNITLVGKKLAEELTTRNIKVLHGYTNFEQILNNEGLKHHESYAVARERVKHVLSEKKNIKLVIDIHRDTHKHAQTTVEISGESVSKIAFVVSDLSSKYEENKYIAELLHNKLQEKYPGLSRGIFFQGGTDTQNTYNQDLFGNSLLLEIGGVENTLEEEYRSSEILSEVIDEVFDDIK
jgi:stage II sporulation protein P